MGGFGTACPVHHTRPPLRCDKVDDRTIGHPLVAPIAGCVYVSCVTSITCSTVHTHTRARSHRCTHTHAHTHTLDDTHKHSITHTSSTRPPATPLAVIISAQLSVILTPLIDNLRASLSRTRTHRHTRSPITPHRSLHARSQSASSSVPHARHFKPSKYFATASCPYSLATAAAVLLYLFTAPTRAPRATSTSHTSRCPFKAAQCNAV